MKKCTVLVLNYNGKHLLKKNLPAVIKASKQARCRVTVVDNGSDDGSVAFLLEQFPLVRRIALAHNYGFAEGNNKGVERSRSDIIIILNNDIVPQANAFVNLLKHFDDPLVFAVSCLQLVKTRKGQFSGGSAMAEFSRGILRHKPMSNIPKEAVPIVFASGGASAFDRKKFLDLGGFDSIYKPFYWEDTDLSARAWARGFKVLFEPKSVVEHRHETTIKHLYPAWYVKAIGDRNMFVYNWRHLNGLKFWFLHLAWLPLQIIRRPLAFAFALPKVLAIVRRRLNDPYRLNIDQILKWQYHAKVKEY